MSGGSYEEYKRKLAGKLKREDNYHRGKGLLVCGVFFLAWFFYILPFHADDVGRINGADIKAGKEYGHIYVYYIDNLQILHTKVDGNDGRVYGIARFTDRNRKEWILCFTPGFNEKEEDFIRFRDSVGQTSDFTVSGYFQMRYLEELPFAADSYFAVYAGNYADADSANILELNADWLCGKYENYTLEVILHPGIPLLSLTAGLVGILYGSFLAFRDRKRRKSEKMSHECQKGENK